MPYPSDGGSCNAFQSHNLKLIWQLGLQLGWKFLWKENRKLTFWNIWQCLPWPDGALSLKRSLISQVGVQDSIAHLVKAPFLYLNGANGKEAKLVIRFLFWHLKFAKCTATQLWQPYIKRNPINKSAATFKPRSKDQNRSLFICVFKPNKFQAWPGHKFRLYAWGEHTWGGRGDLVLTWSHAKVPSRGRTHIMLVTRRTNSQQALNLGWFIDK